MKFKKILIFSGIFVFLASIPLTSQGKELEETMEGAMDLKIVYPDSVLKNRNFSISLLIENKGWEEKQDVTLSITSPESIKILDFNEIKVERLSAGGSFGQTINFMVSADANEGQYFLNVLYSQVLVQNNENPLEPTSSNFAIPIFIKDEPIITIHTTTPETIFPNAEFPFEVELISEDIDITDVTLKVITPEDIEFRGEESHFFSSLKKNKPLSITSRIVTPHEDLSTEQKLPFKVEVSYVDDLGIERTDSKNVPLVLRPRTVMEITSEGGIWVGDFFIAPYVSIGTIVGIPAGTIFSIAIKRALEKKRNLKRTKTQI